MDIQLLLYIVFIFNIIYIATSINQLPSQHISDYILLFETYHFEWNKHDFKTKTSNQNGDNDISTTTEIACTINIPSLCINYTPKQLGFIVSFNDSKYDFMKNTDWTQINYIHANDSIALYDDKYNSQIINDDIIDYHSIDSEENEDEFEKYESYDDDDDDLDESQSPNPAFAGRRLLRRRRAKCRVYLYGSSGFRRRRGGTFRRRRYRRSSLSSRGIRSGESIRSIKVRGSRCCTAKIYRSDNLRGRRVRFRRGSYRSLSGRRRITRIGSMKVYCSRSSRRGRRRSRRRRCPCNSCPCGATHDNVQPIPILLGPMTGMLGHFGYSMHPIMPPMMGAMAGMMGGYGAPAIMSHPAFGHPMMGHGHGFGLGMGMMPGMGMGMGMMPGMMGGMMPGMMGMGGMGMMNPMMLNPMYSGMMGGMGMGGMGMGGMGMYGQQGMNQQQGGQTPVVDVYTDGHKRRRLAMKDDRYNDGVALKKCTVIDGGEICVTYYFGQMLLTLDYTIMKSKTLRIDQFESFTEDQNDIIDDFDDVEYFEESQDSDDNDESDEEYFEDDDYFSEWMMEHEDYELWRNEKIFKFPINIDIENDFKSTNGIDYINTLPWIWNKHQCNDNVLSFLNISICTNSTKDMNNDNDILIYTKYIGNDIDTDDYVDEFELDNLKINVRNIMDWDEIYDINMFNKESINNKKLCRVSSTIKLCVETVEDQYLSGNIKEMQMSVEFL